MPYLQDERANEIAQYASAYKRLNVALANNRPRSKGGRSSPLVDVPGYLYDTGVLDAARATSVESIQDLNLVVLLVRDGRISEAEAQAFLAQRYPDQDWSGGEYGNLLGAAAGADIVDVNLSRPSGDPDAEDASEVASQVASVRDGGVVNSGETSASGIPMTLDDLPEEWDSKVAQQTLESFALQVALELREVANGGVRFPANSVDGAVLAPGSIEAHKLDPFSLNAFVSRWPQSEEAIELKIAPAGGVDRWAEGTKDGPGRIWDVVSYSLPRDYVARPGPVRYRIITPGVRLGVMGLRHLASSDKVEAWNGITEVQYGIVIRGIPLLFGRPPVAVFAAYKGDSPGSNRARDGDMDNVDATNSLLTGILSNADPVFFEDVQVTQEFETDPPVMFQAFDNDSTSGPLVPTADYIARIEGFSFSIPTGRTEKQLFPMLNGRFSQWFPHLAGNAAGLVATAPPGLEYEAPTTASLVFADQSAGLSIDDYETLDEAALATKGTAPSGGNYVEGPPFKFRDIGSLRPSDTSFSLIVQALPFMGVKSGDIVGASSTDVHLENYDQIGLEVVEQGEREVGVDIIVL